MINQYSKMALFLIGIYLFRIELENILFRI
jgi:hypothetical protein